MTVGATAPSAIRGCTEAPFVDPKAGADIDQRQRLALAQAEFLERRRLAEIFFGMTMSTSRSSGLRLVLRGPAKSSASGIVRRPLALATVTAASSATSVGPLSIDGTQVTRLPPSVPRLRVCTAPMECAASTSAGNMSRMTGDA